MERFARVSETDQPLGACQGDVESALARLEQKSVLPRIWSGDHTVWKPSPQEISDRLGWLTVTDAMRGEAPGLRAFADEARESGFRDVVLLGMGGSSLGAEVLRPVAPASAGTGLRLTVLDSTVPSRVLQVAGSIDPARTLFLVSSKSGETIEPNALYRHFRRVVAAAVGDEEAGRSFAAITDPATPLEALAREEGYRKVLLNPGDIGGRYSVLSYFGLAPAALAGVDIRAILDSADRMRSLCGPGVPVRDNPCAWLGATIAALAMAGRDKLTLVAPPSLAAFALWVEHLIAESLGKEGGGSVPVVGEPLAPVDAYGDDRLFVCIELGDVADSETGPAVEELRRSGQPVVRFRIENPHELGAELFRWELATAVAASLLGVNPFDQPDVQAAKDMTDRVLRGHAEEGGPAGVSSLGALLSSAAPRDYLAIMAYVPETPEVDRALSHLRRLVLGRFGIATTLGYGPRLLHSTGQLHKGGPASGLFLQLTADHERDVEIPGAPYTFGGLTDAQALGDLRALRAAGRRVAHLHLGPDTESAVLGLVDELSA